MKIRILIRFARYLKKYWKQEVILLILLIFTSAATLVSPYVLKIIIDDVFPTFDYHMLVKLLLILLGVNIIRLLIEYASDYLFNWISNQITRDIQMNLFKHLTQLPMSFFDKNKAGDLVHRMNSEVNSIQNILTGSFVRLINSACMIIGLGCMLCILNYKLFLLSMVVMPFIFFNTRWFQPQIHKTIKSSREKDADILSFLMERFSNMKLIKSYARSSFEENKLSDKINTLIRLNLKNVRLTSTTRNITLFFSSLIPLLVFGVGGRQVMISAMTVGSLVAFIQYMNRILDPFRNLMGLYFDSIKAVVSMQRIFDLENITPENKDGDIDIDATKDIVYKEVSFKYDELAVLKEVDFTFKAGRKYALVGESGCGKSSMISLLCRFYSSQKGKIYIGDKDIENINVNTLRRRIALVTQDNQLFHESIADNIRYGKPESKLAEIENVTQQTGIYEYIHQLPDGLETVIGDRGVGLSGGQQQRIAIARAILKEADVIILDEATSALDSDSEKAILDNLCRTYADKTIIVISHRLSATREMDEIVCLDQGHIVESGTHEGLIQHNGFYCKLFRNQMA